MQAGTVKFYLADRGFGFIASDDGWRDVFVHVAAIGDLISLQKGQKVTFDMATGRDGRQRAANVALA